MTSWHLDITPALRPNGAVPLSLNDRMHWSQKAARVREVKTVVSVALAGARVPHMDRVHVEMHYRPRTNRFRDVDNTTATLKAAIDAMHKPSVGRPIVDGDDPRYVTWTPPVLHPAVKGEPAALWLVLTAVEDETRSA